MRREAQSEVGRQHVLRHLAAAGGDGSALRAPLRGDGDGGADAVAIAARAHGAHDEPVVAGGAVVAEQRGDAGAAFELADVDQIQVQAAVAVELAVGGAAAEAGVVGAAGPGRQVAEGAVAVVPEQHRVVDVGDVEVGEAVRTVVAQSQTHWATKPHPWLATQLAADRSHCEGARKRFGQTAAVAVQVVPPYSRGRSPWSVLRSGCLSTRGTASFSNSWSNAVVFME